LQKGRAALAYLFMRVPAFSLLTLLLVDASFSQTTDIGSAKTINSPIYQPVLLGSGPNALINRIDTLELIKKGQKDAAIMFACRVNKKGEATWGETYLGTPESKLIEQELQNRLADTRFVPAIYNHLPVDAIYYGTLTFNIINDKPRLRIFANQETEELKTESDFVGPQPFFGNDSKFTGLHYPVENTPVLVDGSATLELKIDAAGNLQAIKLRAEEPPFLGFGGAAIADFRNAKFIPAFRDGKPVACEITLPVFYKPD
jgi:Gram-negative bacterial TonB protein C-terminal